MLTSNHTSVPRPKQRSRLRRRVGREFFIARRRLRWIRERRVHASQQSGMALPHEAFAHHSTLLRELQGVDMALQRNKVTNLRLAIEPIDRLVIEPGETFSLWRRVGRPTARRGYLDGLVLDAGKITRGVGGGLCQLGNLLYWMALHTPLTVVERWRHSYDVFPDVRRTLPFGSGATLSYNYIDLAIANCTDQRWQLTLWLDDTHLHGAIRSEHPVGMSYEIVETDHMFRQETWGGYTRHNRIWQVATDERSGEQQRRLVTENHAIMMYEPLLEG